MHDAHAHVRSSAQRPHVRRRAFAVLGFLLAGALLFHSPKTAAQESTNAVELRARELFNQGVELLRNGQSAEGRDLLRTSLSILPTLPTRYNLALALLRTGEPTEALLHLELLSNSERLEGEQQRLVEHYLAQAQAGTASISASTAEPASWELDGFALAENRASVNVLVDPGRHSLVARVGARRGRVELELDSGESLDVSLTLETPTPRRRLLRWLLPLGAVIVGAALTAVVLTTRRDGTDPYEGLPRFEI